MIRQWIESQPIDFSEGWTPAPEMPGIETRMLSDDMDNVARTGGRTKLVRFQPGAFVTRILEHDFWEESYLIAGQICLDCDDAGRGGNLRSAPLYTCRPPGTRHGVMASPGGCLILEIQYYVR